MRLLLSSASLTLTALVLAWMLLDGSADRLPRLRARLPINRKLRRARASRRWWLSMEGFWRNVLTDA